MFNLFVYGISLGQSDLDTELSSRQRRPRRSTTPQTKPDTLKEEIIRNQSEKSQP